jgi:PAS domain S-box-containing protein
MPKNPRAPRPPAGARVAPPGNLDLLPAHELALELRSYIGLTAEDAAILERLRPLAKPYFGAIADEFYEAIRMHPRAAAVLKDEAQVKRLHASLEGWLGELLEGRYDLEYLLRHARIGRVHVQVGLDVRYMVTAMSRVRVALQRVAREAFTGDEEATRAVGPALARVCDFDLAIMLESYEETFVAGLEQARARERDEMQATLDERRRLFLDALEAANVAVLGFASEGRLLVANGKAEELTGYSTERLAEGDFFARLFGDRAAAMRARWLGPVPGPPSTEDTRSASGASLSIRWHAAAHRGEDPAGPSVIVVGVDLTRERELERRARQNERLAATGTLAAGLAHEIRNPLNGASLHLSVLDRALARMTNVPPQAREAAQVLWSEIKRLSALVTDFLEVARPKPLTLAACDVNDVASAVRALLGPEAAARQVSLALDPSPRAATAMLDADRIRQLLVNLVRNGIEAVSEGGQVSVCVRRLPEAVEIDVADDGVGIPDPTAPIFDAFYTTKERGTGLGLSIVHRIVNDHGGEIRFESRPGSTIFTVRLPARP